MLRDPVARALSQWNMVATFSQQPMLPFADVVSASMQFCLQGYLLTQIA